ncbi:MAG: aromatic ring-hydroxylating dioxygenase subunit alpha [Candidatus Binataceae bacterium]|nr:aromatic ring-hydroxylating dioxygenase subunit alpha [Candidatus Binataceae bacterium]
MRLFSDTYTDLKPGTVPIEPYYSEDYYRREQQRVFRGQWLMVGRVEQLAQPGDYFNKDLAVLESSVFVMRGDDGKLRAFHNSCRHRGNRVLAKSCGKLGKAFTCGFHGWTYDLSGSLIRVPDEECFTDLHKDELGLRGLACDTWNGFIFINTDPRPRESLTAFIGKEMDAQVAGFPFAGMELAATYEVELGANWKFLAEAYQEAYHVIAVHKDTVADRGTVSRWEVERRAALRGEAPPALPDDPTPGHHFSSVRLFDRHRSMSVFGKPKSDHQLPPAIDLCARFAPSPTRSDYGGLNTHKDASWGADLHFLFPNTELLMVTPTWYLQLGFWPVNAQRSRMEVNFYRQPPRTAGELLAMEYFEANFRDIVREDVAALEPAQAMFRSGATSGLWLSDQEIPARHSFEVIDRHVRAD